LASRHVQLGDGHGHAAVVGIIEQNDTETDLVTYVDASTSNTTRASWSGSWYTGPSSGYE
jgi:hypothetical protein